MPKEVPKRATYTYRKKHFTIRIDRGCCCFVNTCDIPDSHLSEPFSLRNRGIPGLRQPNTVTLAPFSVDWEEETQAKHTNVIHTAEHQPSACVVALS